jgi:hypothetical protein
MNRSRLVGRFGRPGSSRRAHAVEGGLGLEHVRPAALHPELVEELGHLGIANPPTVKDRARIFHAVFEYLDRHAETWPGGRAELKASLVDILGRSDYGLSATGVGLDRLFRRKLAEWEANGKTLDAVTDGRRGNAGRRRRQLCADCQKLLTGAATDLDGNIAQAFRRLHLARLFCSTCAGTFPFDPVKKSYVAQCIRDQVAPTITRIIPWRRGPDYVRLHGPSVRRIADFGPGDNFIADDVTWNHFFWYQEPDGRFNVSRGECLIATDERTQYPLGYVLIGRSTTISADSEVLKAAKGATYTSRHCGLLLRHLHESVGMPHKVIKLENGRWRQGCMANLPRTGWDSISWREASESINAAKLGFELQYVKPGSPRSKAIIERFIGIMQNMMRCEAAFVGFCERTDKREDTDQLLRLIRAQKLNPNGLIPSQEQMCAIIDKILIEFRAEKQNGSWLRGVSPEEAWLDGVKNPDGRFCPGIRTRPLRQLPRECRHYFDTHKTLKKVRFDGFQICNDTFWGTELEPYIGQTVEVSCDMEDTSIAHFRCPDSGKVVTLEAKREKASTATREEQQYFAREKACFIRPGKLVYDSLPHPLRTNIIRDDAHGTEADKEVGRQIEAGREAIVAARRERRQEEQVVKRLAAKAGCAVPDRIRNRSDLEAVLRRRAAERAGEGSQAT